MVRISLTQSHFRITEASESGSLQRNTDLYCHRYTEIAYSRSAVTVVEQNLETPKLCSVATRHCAVLPHQLAARSERQTIYLLVSCDAAWTTSGNCCPVSTEAALQVSFLRKITVILLIIE